MPLRDSFAISAKPLPRFSFELLTLAYFALWFLFRETTFDGIAMDEADELLFAQRLGRGYMFRNPPLFTWTLYVTEQLFGAHIDLPMLLRFSALGAGFIALYHSCLQIFVHPRLATIAAISPITLYVIGWRMVIQFSHSAFLFMACAFTLWGVLFLEKRPTAGRYALLGIITGCGLLAKYNFLIFLLSLVISACFDKHLIHLVINKRALVTIALAILIVIPHATWMVEHWSDISFVMQRRLGTASSWDDLRKRIYGIYALLRSLLEFVVPFILFFAISIARRTKTAFATASDGERHRLKIAGLIRRSVLIQLATMATLIFLTGAVQIRVHHLMTIVLFPIWLIAQYAERLSVRRLGAVIAIVSAINLIAIPLAFHSGRASARRISEGTLRVVDYSKLAAMIRNEALDRGTLVVLEEQFAMSGSVRPYLPKARILTTKFPEFDPGRVAETPGHMFLWREGGLDPAYSSLIERYLQSRSAAFITSIEIPLTRSERTITFHFLAVRPRTGMQKEDALRLERALLSATSVGRGWRNG